MSNLTKLHDTYTTNIAKFPALYDELANQLGVSTESVFKIGTGLIPLDEQGNWSWVFPERNVKGDIVGLNKRLTGGSKYMVKGSKRGLSYIVNYDTEQYEKRQWTRVSIDYPCPLCGKPDGCLYPEGEHHNPNAVICVHISSGAIKPMELGYLHVLDPARQKLQMQNYSLLLPSEYPILVVEGASDVCAAYDLDFTAVGKPSAASKSKDLVELLSGHKCVIFGENDAGAGRAGMESTFVQLQKKCPDCTKVMPPGGIKDLRQWLIKGVTQVEVLEYIDKNGDCTLNTEILEDSRSVTVADNWITNYKTINGVPTFGIYNNEYIGFDDIGWEELTKNDVRSQLYKDIGHKSYMNTQGIVSPYNLTRAKASDILEACTEFCLIKKTAPCWFTPGNYPDPSRIIICQNGILDVDRYIAGDTTNMMHNHDPNLFSFYKLPYDFDENAESLLWEDTIRDTFEHEDKIQLATEWFGINFIPDMSYEKMMLFKGQPRSGKGTYCNTLQAALGGIPNASVTTFPTLRGAHGLAPLKKALSVIVGDSTSNSRPGNEDAILLTILNIVGQDATILNPKHKDHLDLVTLRCRFTFGMNFFPRFRNDSGALEDRTMILTFNNSHSGREDITLKNRLRQEASSGKLLNFALRGLKSLYTNGKFIIPRESAEAMRAFRELVSPLRYFIQRCIESDTKGSGVIDDWLYEIWKRWCKNTGLKYSGKSEFIHKILAMIPNVVQIMPGEVGNLDRMLMGIKVTQWAEDNFAKG